MTVDQALICGLGTVFRVFVSGLVFCPEGGPDLLCWTTNFFIKEAADPAFAS
jgi:hypothetical protein